MPPQRQPGRVKAGEQLGKDGGCSFSTIAEVIHLEIIR
jgi:hypothetical protein